MAVVYLRRIEIDKPAHIAEKHLLSVKRTGVIGIRSLLYLFYIKAYETLCLLVHPEQAARGSQPKIAVIIFFDRGDIGIGQSLVGSIQLERPVTFIQRIEVRRNRREPNLSVRVHEQIFQAVGRKTDIFRLHIIVSGDATSTRVYLKNPLPGR